MSSREEFAGVAPSGEVFMSGATTGLEVLDRALAGWPVLESTRGPHSALHRNVASCTGPRPRAMQNTIEDSAPTSKSLIHTPILRMNGFLRNGSILMKISLAIRGTMTDFLPLFSVRMGQHFLDIEAEHLDNEAIQKQTVVERRA